VDPVDSAGRRLLQHVMEGLIYEGWEHHKAGRRSEALRIFDLAADLEPGNREVQQRRAFIVAGADAKQPEAAAKLADQVQSTPDDFRANQQLDYALAAQGKFDQVIVLWTEYLSHHPEDARAHLERGGAYFRSGKRQEALADARRACELGLNEGCLRAKQVAGR
jgi:Flp pilus assembly protein TadD